MASLWEKAGVFGAGAVEGGLKGGLKAIGWGALLGGLMGAALPIYLAFGVTSGLGLLAAGIAAVGMGGIGAYMGASFLAPLGAALGFVTKPFSRLREANEVDLAEQQTKLMDAKLEYQQAVGNLQNAAARAQGGYATVPSMQQQGVPLDKSYTFNNEAAKSNHVQNLAKQRAELEAYANLSGKGA